MIFNKFDSSDIVSGRMNRVASGFWPAGETFWSSSQFIDNFYELTQSSVTPSPSYGSSIYDIRRTMYYLDVFPDTTTHDNNDPYYSVAYGNYYGNEGSGSFNLDTSSIKAYAAKVIYSQYQNLLIGSSNLSGKFQFKSGSSDALTTADDIFVINFSSYKMKDKIDEGVFEITLTGSKGSITLRDDSPFLSKTSTVYNLIPGTINNSDSSLPAYQGIGLLYPNDGVAIFNAQVIDSLIGLSSNISGTIGQSGESCPANYSTASIEGIPISGQSSLVPTTVNHKVFFWSIQNANNTFKVRKSEYVAARHYFVRVKNRDFNYSNNPTYVYDGTDGVNARGTIYNQDFITNPTTYITTVGLYNDNNELVAVAKLSRPAYKDFSTELLLEVRLDF